MPPSGKSGIAAAMIFTIGSPAIAGSQVPEGGVGSQSAQGLSYEVARPGDAQLGCAALAGEIETVERELAQMQAQTDRIIAGIRPRSRIMPGQREAAVVNSIGGAVVPGGPAVVNSLTHQAVTAAREGRQEIAMSTLGEHIERQAAGKALVMNRFDHLLRISERKNCGITPASLDEFSSGDGDVGAPD